jgi:type IV pilus assembly protein PilB
VKNLPSLLLAEGKATKEQIQRALDKQKKTGVFLGEILIEEGILDEQSFITLLAKNCKIPHLSLLDYIIDDSIVALIPK